MFIRASEEYFGSTRHRSTPLKVDATLIQTVFPGSEGAANTVGIENHPSYRVYSRKEKNASGVLNS
jgi:hypothetical protein